MASRMICFYVAIGIALLLTCLQGGFGVDITLSFVKEPEDVIAKRNQPVLLNCSSSSSSEHGAVNVTWYHKGALISDGRRQILNNGSLYIRKLRVKKHPGSSSSATTGIGVANNLNIEMNGDDTGPYYCTIANRIGTLVSRQAHIYLASMAKKFTIEPEPAAVEEDDVVRFTCQIQAFPVPKYSWQTESNTSEDLSDPWIGIPQVDSRFTVLAGGILQISGVLLTDAGNYRCVAHGFEHDQASNKAHLQVNPATRTPRAPTFLTKESTVNVKAGETAILECLVSGYPPTEISWSRQGEKPLRTNGVSRYGMGNLVLSSVTLDDEGVYICTSSSKDPEELESNSIAQFVHLYVQKPPEFLKKPQSLSGLLGRTQRLECETQGVPRPTITWLKDGRVVDISGRLNLRNNELVFSQTITSDAGLYQCKAENFLGQRLAAARLQVITHPDQPSPPTGLSAITRSNTSIELSWILVPSSDHLPIRAYTIHYSLTSGGSSENTIVVVNNSRVIDKLIPYTNYTFYVRAWTTRSPSDPSESITWMTGEDIPLAAPAAVLTSNLTALHITWDELLPNFARGVITRYKIQWRKKGQNSYNVIDVAGNVRDWTVTGLRPGYQYDVRVLAATKVGYPVLPDSKWPWVTHIMPNSVVPHVPLPPTLILTVVNFSSVKVTWKLPDDNEFEAKGFELRYGKQNRNATKSYTLPNILSEFLITDLEPHTIYEVRINGFNENGNGTESVGVIATPQETSMSDDTQNNWYVIEPPSELEAISTSARSIRLVWKPPLTNKNISYYMVRCNPVHNTSDFNTSVVRYFKSEKPEVNLTDLMPYTQYEFSVRSHDQEDKPGPYSNKVECKTLEDVPTAPQLLRWFILDPNTIRVTWQPPRYPNGVIISYDVLYNVAHGPQLTYEQWSIVKEQGTESASLVNGLNSNTLYYLCVRAETRAGAGPPTEKITLQIPKFSANQSGTVPKQYDEGFQDSKTGIVVGVSIGVCCMIICALIIIFRNRCFPSPAPLNHRGLHSQGVWGNGYAHNNSNGNGHIPREYRISSSESHEMDSITPMLTTIPDTTSPYLDTKGGYVPVIPYANGHVDHKTESEVPCGNGHSGSQSLLINITLNPQFEMNNETCYNEDKDKQKSHTKKCHGSPSSSAPLLDKSAESTSSSSDGNQPSPHNIVQSASNMVIRDKHSSSNGNLLPAQDCPDQSPQNSHHCQQQRPHSHHSSDRKHHHKHHNQSSKHRKRNSAPSSSDRSKNNSPNPTSISPSSTTASESLLPTPSSSSTVVIIPTVTKASHHTNGKDGGRRWRPLSHTAISAAPAKVMCSNDNSTRNSVTRPKSNEFVRLSSSNGNGGGTNSDHTETSQKPFSNSSSFSSPTSSSLSSNSHSQSPSPTSHLLCATNHTNAMKLVVQT